MELVRLYVVQQENSSNFYMTNDRNRSLNGVFYGRWDMQRADGKGIDDLIPTGSMVRPVIDGKSNGPYRVLAAREMSWEEYRDQIELPYIKRYGELKDECISYDGLLMKDVS
jgi:hypothetical protein